MIIIWLLIIGFIICLTIILIVGTDLVSSIWSEMDKRSKEGE
jgi:hypothetical protein